MPDLAPRERTALAYDRLQLINDTVESPEKLADDPHLLASLHEWTGFVDPTLATLSAIHYNLFLGSLVDHSPDSRRSLDDFTSLRRTGTFLCTELEHGSDVAAIETRAVWDRATGGFVLHTPTSGAQKFMPTTSAIGGPKTAVVAARLIVEDRDEGVFLFLVPLRDENGPCAGVRTWVLPERMGTPVDHCLTAFDHYRLPREALLEGRHGELHPDGTLTSNLGNRRKRVLHSIQRVTAGKLSMSAAAVGASRAALTIAVRYAHARRTSGPRAGQTVPLAAHRSHIGRLLYRLTTAYAMTFLHRETVTRWANRTPENTEDVARLIAVSKSWITWQTRDITLECRERCGAQGLFTVNGLADLITSTEGTITAEGDNLVIALKAGAEMLFSRESPAAPQQHVEPSEHAMADPRFLRDLLAQAVSVWQDRARTSLRQGPSGAPVDRWNQASAAALKMVDAAARLHAADAFLDAAEQAVGPEARTLLRKLVLLFLLKEVSEHTGDLLAEGHLTIADVRSLPEVIEQTIADLTPHTMTLVEAFDLPAEILATIPIAHEDYTRRISALAHGGSRIPAQGRSWEPLRMT
ncbi:acyl-CoA dehydrogenase family protein [Streptomyces luteolus]|uniref:Acyl-CoA dehydrogenase n=1 Tax=Streptomyces luteolus TaxID=3043615 RepID=A0ABT6T7X1_9ACTN|nr:acyl-CoA dehydrogenase [Streptomyces sp. B-S-A12]MDI3423706.1 acyl-CoA dehydrogenase [Streptomyces sp. B-S-A12]